MYYINNVMHIKIMFMQCDATLVRERCVFRKRVVARELCVLKMRHGVFVLELVISRVVFTICSTKKTLISLRLQG